MDEIGKPDLTRRNVYRCIFDGRYKLVRYFSVNDYHVPGNIDELFKHNDVGLYDLKKDPNEMENLANPDHKRYSKKLLGKMNTKLNALIKEEIGKDRMLMKSPK